MPDLPQSSFRRLGAEPLRAFGHTYGRAEQAAEGVVLREDAAQVAAREWNEVRALPLVATPIAAAATATTRRRVRRDDLIATAPPRERDHEGGGLVADLAGAVR